MKKICPICKAEYLGGEVFCAIDAARLITPSQASIDPSSDDPLIGVDLDRYRIRRRIGEGGMGLVYEGLHLGIEKQVAIKVLRDDFSSRPDVVERFRQEAKSASRIGHENIVDISDFGQTPTGQSYFVMEYLEGEDLADCLAREGTLPVQRVISIATQCARALAAAHAKGIVHRDMKPENVFLVKRLGGADFVKIVDFGIAKMSDIETAGAPGRKLTKTGMIFGTPEYMSPEQAAGKGLDHRVDIYALGVIIYELITGRVPFIGDTFMGVLTQHMFEAPLPLREANAHVACSRELELVMSKCLAKDPNERYQAMEELATALEEAKHGRVSEGTLVGYSEAAPAREELSSRSPTLSALPEPPPRKNLIPMILAGALVLLTGVIMTYAVMDKPQEQPPVQQSPAATIDTVEATPEAQPPPEEPSEPLAPEVVALTVETTPPGARVRIDGHEELVCEETPCTLDVPLHESLTVNAQRARLRAQRTIELDVDETINLTLRAPRRFNPRMSGTMMRMGSGPRANDLKMVNIFE